MRRITTIIAFLMLPSIALAQVNNPGVAGPASATSGHIATFNGTNGKIIQDGGAVPSAPPCTSFGTTTGTCLQGAGALGTPSSGTATNLIGLPVGSGISGLGLNVIAALSNPTNAGAGIVVQIGPSAWVPADGSGASLTFSGVSANYTQLGNMVFAYFTLLYPSTANANPAIIQGLPVNAPNHGYAATVSFCNSSSATFGLQAQIQQNTSEFLFFNAATDVAITNANLSAIRIACTIIYPAS